MSDQTTPSRRSVISAGAAVVAGVGALSACSSNDVASTAGSAAAGAASAASAAGGAAGGVVTALSEIPLGGAVVKEIGGKKVVLAQPEAGKVVAFDAACTHKGCPVAAAGKQLTCSCHGSAFNSTTGAVEKGPATQPLASLKVSVSASGVTLA
jgi:Rieske Fe-S protein